MNDFEFKKSLGQNFIKDDNIIDKIIANSDLDKDTLVIEIGPGAGSLSKKIIPLCGYAILYEIDTRLESILKSELSNNNNFKIIFGDFLEQDITKIREEYKKYRKIYVVANLPYYITTAIINKLLIDLYPDKMIIMVQDEVADRIVSKNGSRSYGMISVLLGSRYNIKKLFKVSRNCFKPVPDVDSAVISFDKNNRLGNIKIDNFEKILKDAFKFKRKTLKNNFMGYDLPVIDSILKKYDFSLNNRAEDIPIEVFIEIAKNL